MSDLVEAIFLTVIWGAVGVCLADVILKGIGGAR